MDSRIKKYHRETADEAKRSEKNQKLYQNIYEGVKYSNIEAIAELDKTNEVDLEKIKAMLNKQNKKTIPSEEEPLTPEVPEEEVNVVAKEDYDVKSFIESAKNNRNDNDQRSRRISEDYQKLPPMQEKEEGFDAEEKLQELLQTIHNTQVLADLNKEESKRAVADANAQTVADSSKKVDRSFYTSSLNFKDDDFEDLKDLNQAMQKNTKVIIILMGSLFLIMGALMIYIIMRVIS